MDVRLQKILAQAGIASRRAAETLVSAGRVRVNGTVVSELGARANPYDDKIEVDGRRILAERPIYAVLHKPRGVVSTANDPEGRPTVLDDVKSLGRVYPVGRLDFATSGVLLLTNDGDFANGLMHPKRGVPKTYVVKVRGEMTETDLDRWAEGIELEDGMTKPAAVRFIRHEGDKTWFEITITEGRNHQIRRMGDATGFFVMRLARVSFAGIDHVGLRPGAYRLLTRDELNALKEAYGVPKKVPRLGPDASRPEGNRGGRRAASPAAGRKTPRAIAGARGQANARGQREDDRRPNEVRRRDDERPGRRSDERRTARRPDPERRTPGDERRTPRRPDPERRTPGDERRTARRPDPERRPKPVEGDGRTARSDRRNDHADRARRPAGSKGAPTRGRRKP